MKTENKILLANTARNIVLAGILLTIPLFFTTYLYNSFRLPKNTLFIVLTTVALFFSIIYFLEKKSIDWKRYKFILILTGIFLLIKIASCVFSTNSDISFWGSYNRAEGLLLWIFFILYFILLLFNNWDKSKLKSYSFVIVISNILLAGYGIMQKFELIPDVWATGVSGRVMSTMGNPLNFSSYLILTFPFIYFCLIYNKNIFIRIITGIGLGVSAYALLLTGSRSSWIAFLFANFIVFTFYFLKKNKKIFLILILIGVISAAAFSYIGFKHFDKFEQPTIKRLFSVFDPEDTSNKQRWVFWQGSWKAFTQKPVLGWGQDSVAYAFDKNYPPKLTDLPETHIDRAHNWHLDVLVMEGALSWILTMFILIFGTYKAIKLINKKEKEKSAVGLIFVYIMAACLLQFFFMFALISPHVIIIFALALVLALSYDPTNEPKIFKSKILEKLKKNSNLYLIFGIGLAAFIFFIVLKPIVANRELSRALFTQENLEVQMGRAAEIMPSQFYKQQFGSLYLKFANEGRLDGDEIRRIENGKKASDIFEQVVPQYPYHYINYQFLAESYDLQRNYELTDATFQKAIDNFPTRHDIYWKWGNFLKIRGENDLAIEKYKKATEVDLDIARPYYELSLLYKELGNEEKAAEYKKIAIEKGVWKRFMTKEDQALLESSATQEQKTDITNEASTQELTQ